MASRLARFLKTRVNNPLIGHRSLSRTLTPATNPSPFALIRHGNLSQTLTLPANPSSFALRPFSSRPIDNSPLPFHSSTEMDDNGFRWDLKELDSDQTLWALYERWMAHFGRTRGPDEKLQRFEIFKENIRQIVNHNRRRPDPECASWGLSRFTDSDADEGYPPFQMSSPAASHYEVEMVHADVQLKEMEESRNEKGQKRYTCTYTMEDEGDDDCYGCRLESSAHPKVLL